MRTFTKGIYNMKLDFRIDWGYQYLYSRRHYHPVYIWDGELTVEGGVIEKIFKLDYPVIWFGPALCAKETLLDRPKWESRTKRGLAGVRVEADVDEKAVFKLHTASGDFEFSAKDIAEKGRIEFPVGPRFQNCHVIVTRTGYFWFLPEKHEGEQIFEYGDLGLPVHDWARLKLGFIAPGEGMTIEVDVPEVTEDFCETIIHTTAMCTPEYNPEKETTVEGMMDFSYLCDGENILDFKRFYRKHDHVVQMLEDEWTRLKLTPGRHKITLVNRHPEFYFAVHRVVVSFARYNHGQLSIPEWALTGEEVIGKVFATHEDSFTLTACEDEITLDCVPGWNEFRFTAKGAPKAEIINGKSTATLEVYDVESEKYPVKVGYDMTPIPHDRNGFMDWLLDYTYRTKLGNYVVFRSFTGEPKPEDMYDWGKFCREHHIYSSCCIFYEEGSLARGAGDMMNDCGPHEYTGKVYAWEPEAPHSSDDMKVAYEKFIAYLKEKLDDAHKICETAAFGDASGGIRHAFLAGADFVRAETMVPHTMTLLSQARPASEALGKGRWGVHIAIHHCFQPYFENHLGQFFLSMMQPWMMGAETIYEEDSVFGLWKEERQAWSDALVKGKRDMLRSFFKFASTHPRRGVNKRNIAFLEGRYAAPFNGFICDVEQDPNYSVWGLYGNHSHEWGHRQPEKCRQILDVLMKGASTHPFRQKFDERRFYFSGTPYGDFDCIPVEASSDYIGNYKLLLNLGWNTMIDEDYEKLKSFVEAGGVLLTGIPQFSTHTKRDFLRDMDDLALYRGGDLSELCGFKALGRGEVYCGQWNSSLKGVVTEPELSAMPNDFTEEDGVAYLEKIDLTTAEVVAWDTFTGEPVLVRNKVGEGYVYTLTFHAYPGHEKFQKLSAAFTEYLCGAAKGDTYVEDDTDMIFWTVWEDEDEKILMLLNTDWAIKDNVVTAKICSPYGCEEVPVKEREALICRVTKDGNVYERYTL